MNRFLILAAVLIFSRINAQSVAWIDTIVYGSQNLSYGVAAGNTGYIYMSGAYTGGSFTHKYDQSGALIWRDTIYLGAVPGGVVCDAAGNVYTVIWAPSSYVRIGGMNYPGGSTSYIVKYNSSGQIQWVVNHARVSGDIAVDNYGYVYISGIYSSSSGFTAKYDSNGNFILEWPVNGSIAFDKYNNLYLTSSAVTKFDPSGNQLWSYSSTGGITSAVDSLGNCYISTPGAYGNADLIKLNPAGQQVWDISVPYWGGRGIFVKNTNEIYVSGQWGSGNTANGAIFSKYDASSNLSWSYQMPNSASISPDRICAKQNDIYACFNHGLNYYAYLAKISTPFTTSIKEENNASGLTIFPNPSNTSFNIRYKNASGGRFMLSIRDAAGKCIRTTGHGDFTGELNETIDLGGFARGVYFAEVSGNGFKETRKLILE